MKRRLLNLLAGLSLILCVAVVVMWIRSHFRTDNVMHLSMATSNHEWRLHDLLAQSGSGDIQLTDSTTVSDDLEYQAESGIEASPGWRLKVYERPIDLSIWHIIARPRIPNTDKWEWRLNPVEVPGAFRCYRIISFWFATEAHQMVLGFPMVELGHPEVMGKPASLIPPSMGIGHYTSWQIGMPYWFLVVVTGIAPAAFARHFVRHRLTAKVGCCRTCGYDLRATPSRCPECGTVPEKDSGRNAHAT